MRPLFKLLMLFGMTAYLIFAFFTFITREDTKQCRSLNIVIADSAQATLITAKDIDMMLRKASLYPIGRSMKDVDLIQIQNKLQSDPFIREAICMKTPGENVNVFVVQRLPLLRIIADNGEDYYVDSKGFPMAARGYEADQYFCQKKPASFRNVAQSRRVLEQSGDANPSTAQSGHRLGAPCGQCLGAPRKSGKF